jgi:glycosyltransferase involved in cell wall biosynthesis
MFPVRFSSPSLLLWALCRLRHIAPSDGHYARAAQPGPDYLSATCAHNFYQFLPSLDPAENFNMISTPSVTVFIPTFNYASYIPDAIESVIRQTYPQKNIEIIVVDDGSTDNTQEAISPYRDRVSYHFQPNAGKAAATQKGIDLARGKYFFNLDADDIYMPDCIAKVVAEFEKDNTVSQVSWLRYRWSGLPSDLPLAETYYRRHGTVTIIGNQCLGEYLAGKRRVVLGSGYAGLTQILQRQTIPADVDMYIDRYLLIICACYGNITLLDDVLTKFRRHPTCFSEGEISRETTARRAQRYEMSALGVLNASRNLPLNRRALKLMELFYMEHKAEAERLRSHFSLETISSYTFSLSVNIMARPLLATWKGYVWLSKRCAGQVLRVVGLRTVSS